MASESHLLEEKTFYPFIGRIKDEMAARELSQNAMAREMNVPPSYLSLYLREMLHTELGESKCEQINKDIEKFFVLKSEQALGWQDVRLKLEITDLMKQKIRFAHQSGKNLILDAPSGTGKTVACDLYCEEEPLAFKISITQHTRGVTGLLKTINRAITRSIPKGSIDELFENIVQKLRGTNRLMIVDQAHEASIGSYRELIALWNEVRIPIVLVGTHEIYERMRGIGRGIVPPEVSRRFPNAITYTLEPRPKDTVLLCHHYGVEEAELIRYVAHAHPIGGIGIITDILQNSQYLANGQKITMRELTEAMELAQIDKRLAELNIKKRGRK